MQVKQLFFFLSACLFLSISAADAQDLDSLAFAAAEYELQLYDGASEDAVSLLMAKASCQETAGLWTEALETYGRIPMFFLDGESRRDVTSGILRCQLNSGLYEDFETTLNEAMLMQIFSGETCTELESFMASHPVRLRNEDAALLLSAVPGLGHLYAGKPVQGIGHLALNGAVIAAGVASFCSGLYVCAFLGGGMVLAKTHSQNSASAVKAVAEHNREALRNRCVSMLDIVLRS